MFAYDHVIPVNAVISDPGADGTINIWKVPARMTKCEVIEAWAQIDTAIAGEGTTVVLSLFDMGTAGTTVGGTICSALGASGTGDWSANTPRAFTISGGTLAAGHYVALKYDEAGTVAPKNITVSFTVVPGVGA